MGWTPLDWLRRSANGRTTTLQKNSGARPGGESESIGDLVARRKFSRAIYVLRTQFEAGNRSVDLRLQFADVLVLAGKSGEAVPVLIGVADEVATADRARAIDALRRVEKIDPGREDVSMRLATLGVSVSERGVA